MNVFHSLPDSFKVGTRMEAINALFPVQDHTQALI